MIHLDTHVVAWLYAGRTDLLSDVARAKIEGEPLAVSPMVLLELEYLHEIGRVTQPSVDVITHLAAQIGLSVSQAPFDAVIASARPLSWTRDPFDRIIVGQSIAEGSPLVTRDETIRANHGGAVW